MPRGLRPPGSDRRLSPRSGQGHPGTHVIPPGVVPGGLGYYLRRHSEPHVEEHQTMCFYMVYAPQPLRNHMWFRMVHTIRNHIQRSVVPDGARHSEPHLTEPMPPLPLSPEAVYEFACLWNKSEGRFRV